MAVNVVCAVPLVGCRCFTQRPSRTLTPALPVCARRTALRKACVQPAVSEAVRAADCRPHVGKARELSTSNERPPPNFVTVPVRPASPAMPGLCVPATFVPRRPTPPHTPPPSPPCCRRLRPRRVVAVCFLPVLPLPLAPPLPPFQPLPVVPVSHAAVPLRPVCPPFLVVSPVSSLLCRRRCHAGFGPGKFPIFHCRCLCLICAISGEWDGQSKRKPVIRNTELSTHKRECIIPSILHTHTHTHTHTTHHATHSKTVTPHKRWKTLGRPQGLGSAVRGATARQPVAA